MSEMLSYEQSLLIAANSPLLDRISATLPVPLQKKLLAFEQRNGLNCEIDPRGAFVDALPDKSIPTMSEAQQIFGEIYLTLDEQNMDKKLLRDIMDTLGLNPSARRQNWVEQAVNRIAEWFR